MNVVQRLTKTTLTSSKQKWLGDLMIGDYVFYSFYRNEDYPTAVTAAGECEYKIKKCDDAICTVRLDFEVSAVTSIILTF